MNANGLYSGVEGYVIPGTNSGVGGGVANGAYSNEGKMINQPLLDIFPGAAAAFSLRKIRTRYTGAAIRVRRSLDNTEVDIGFDADGNLNQTQLINFVGAGDGFVSTWYDQSSNVNITMATQASQPTIVSSGIIQKENNKPTILFDGINDVLSTGNIPFFRNISAASSYVVARWVSNPTTLRALFFCSIPVSQSQTRFFLGGGNASGKYTIGSRRTDGDTTTLRNTSVDVNTSSLIIQTGFVNYGIQLANIYINGAEQLSQSVNPTAGNTSDTNPINIAVGSQTTAASNANAKISEVIAYENVENRLGIEQNINQYYKIY